MQDTAVVSNVAAVGALFNGMVKYYQQNNGTFINVVVESTCQYTFLYFRGAVRGQVVRPHRV